MDEISLRVFNADQSQLRQQREQEALKAAKGSSPSRLQQYSETLHRLFAQQRKDMKIDESMQESPSEDEGVGQQVDLFLEERQKAEARTVKQSRAESPIKSQKSSKVLTTSEAKQIVNQTWRDVSEERSRLGPAASRVDVAKQASLERKKLNSRLLALRNECVVSCAAQAHALSRKNVGGRSVQNLTGAQRKANADLLRPQMQDSHGDEES